MEEAANSNTAKKKSHRERHSGRKAEKKKLKDGKNVVVQELTDKQRNPKAFAFNSAIRAERKFRRKQDMDTKKQHIPVVDRTPLEPPPILIAVVGPPKVGKTTLINNLIKLFTKSPLTDIKGPVTIVTGKKRRITFIECNNDINCMIDLAKVADLVLLLCDASFGFEMEIFEFLNICQVHGMPRIMGVLTHLDLIKNTKTLKNTKKNLKHRFWTEVYPGAKLFYLSGKVHDEYLRNEIKNLGRFISVMKFRPLTWRSTHSYLLVDRYEDLTNQELVRKSPKCDRNISLYGYIRGVPLKKESSVHIAGVGDLRIQELSFLPDPCPLPDQIKKRALVEKEKLIYAPFSGVGGIVYDKDAVYVELGGSHSHKKRDNQDETNNIVTNLIDAKETLDVKMAHSEMQIFTGGEKLVAKDFGRTPMQESDESGEEEEGESGQEENEESGKEEDEESGLEEDEESGQEEDEESGQEEDEESGQEEEEDEGSNEKEKEEYDESKVGVKREVLKASQKQNTRKVVEDKKNLDNTDELAEELSQLRKKSYKEEKVEDSGRIRRKVIFGDFEDSVPNEETESEDSDDEIEDKKSMKNVNKHNMKKEDDIHKKVSDVLKNLEQKKEKSKSFEEDDEFDNGFEEDESEFENKEESEEYEDKSESEDELPESENEEDMGVRWKENLAKKAQDAFLERQSSTQNLMKLVYGVFDVKTRDKIKEIVGDNEDTEELGGLLRKVSNQQQKTIMDKETLNSEESSLILPWNSKMRDWTDLENKPLIVNCFVTGQWKESEDASELLKLDDAENLSDIDGDFEDLETGEKHTAQQPRAEKRKREDTEKDSIADKVLLAEKKKKLKEKFDSEYDNGEKNTFYDELKLTAENQAQLNKSCFENMPDDVRTQIEGFRPGMYVRMEFQNVPAEFINNFDPTYPVVIGSLNIGEENIGYVNVKIKKHRWYSRILKTSDPLIISLGWRRFQTIPLYSKLEDDLKFRYLKYTPQHLGCNAHFWGPITPQGTGFLALQTVDSNPELLKNQGFRIAATGVVQELDKSTQIMKKLKLIGYPLKIYKKTAFIKDMFNSSLEVAKFEGARIKTVSGIRGQIKKPVTKPEGCFRATFEDKIKLSDIVFCRTWYKVDVPEFYNPLTNLLLPIDQKNSWKGARTKGELKRENNIKTVVNTDHLYKPIIREEKPFAPLVIPRKLQAELPYRDKPKHGIKLSEKKKGTPRVAVVLEPKEQKIANMMKMIKTVYHNKQEKMKQETKERLDKHRQMIAAQEASKDKNIKKKKKDVMRVRSKRELSKKNK